MPVTAAFLGELQQLVSLHGYWVVGLIVGMESPGLPLPGEAMLVLAAIYAATEPSFNIWVVIAVAAFGATIGDNIGFGSDQDTATHFCCDTASVLACLNPVSSSDSTCS
jgi:membrane protein YqaA with SNARE-associated domain